uniref:U5 small nuclear ribonucleoprotein TSSC4 n=1 Tax=Bos mutus grunniens TaxID=30521 RepID=A0A8B9XCM5_BOSMU
SLFIGEGNGSPPVFLPGKSCRRLPPDTVSPATRTDLSLPDGAGVDACPRGCLGGFWGFRPDEPPRPRASPEAVQPFHLRGTSSTFSQRSHSIFDGLEGRQAGCACCDPASPGDGGFQQLLTPSSQPAAGSQVGLLGALLPKGAPVPDYVTHPERWTRYSLDDVAEASEQTEQPAAALAFLGPQNLAAPATTCLPSTRTLQLREGGIFTKPTRASEARPDRKRVSRKVGNRAGVTLGFQEAAGGPVELAHLARPGSPKPRSGVDPRGLQEVAPAGGDSGFPWQQEAEQGPLRSRGGSPEAPGAEL